MKKKVICIISSVSSARASREVRIPEITLIEMKILPNIKTSRQKGLKLTNQIVQNARARIWHTAQ